MAKFVWTKLRTWLFMNIERTSLSHMHDRRSYMIVSIIKLSKSQNRSLLLRCKPNLRILLIRICMLFLMNISGCIERISCYNASLFFTKNMWSTIKTICLIYWVSSCWIITLIKGSKLLRSQGWGLHLLICWIVRIRDESISHFIVPLTSCWFWKSKFFQLFLIS